MTTTKWALARVAENEPAIEVSAGRRIQELVDGLRAARSGNGQLFGLSASNLEPEGRPVVAAAIVEQLVRWKELYEAAGDTSSLLDFDAVARRFGVAELAMTTPPTLLSAPDGNLGAREGLSDEWRSRLERLDAVVRGERSVDFAAVSVVGFEDADAPPVVECGAPEPDVLWEKAVRYESATKKPYPRELAAFAMTLNGLTIDDDPFLRPISQWTFNDEGLEIGCGGYVQGRLTIEEADDEGYLAAPVVDRDDDGEVRAECVNLGAFIDALLGAKS